MVEYFVPSFDDMGNPFPPPEAIFEYYDENYYYELVVP